MSFGMRLVSMARRAATAAAATATAAAAATATAAAPATSWGLRRFSSALVGPICPRFGKLGTDGLPESVDWRTQNAVTPVSNQGRCGACWSFATTASMEGVNAIMTNELLKLSEQQLLDCCTCSSHGCKGGYVTPTLRYILRHGGQVEYDVYPYVAHVNFQHKRVIAPAVRIDDFAYSFSITEKDLKVAVASRPVVVAVGADISFQKYRRGVLDGFNYTLDQMTGGRIGHYVTVVGYGVSQFGELFWLAKNSKGIRFGEEGYIRIARENGKEGGAFGIARYMAYPIKRNANNNPKCEVMTEAEIKGCRWVHWF